MLHIGQSKTGTSALQAFLAGQRSVLAERGYCYLDVRRAGLPIGLLNHNALSDSLTKRLTYPNLTAEGYGKWIENARNSGAYHTLILSAEHFFGGQPRTWEVASDTEFYNIYRQKLGALRALLRADDVQVIVYLRNHLDWFRSSMLQSIKYQLVMGRPDLYQSDRQYFEANRVLLKFGKLLDLWSEFFGASRILAVPYDRKALVEGSVVQDFAFRISCDISGMKTKVLEADANHSLTAEYIEVKKCLNREPKTVHKERAVIACLETLSARANSSWHYALDPAVVKDIRVIAEADSAYLQNRYLDGGTKLDIPAWPDANPVPEAEVARAMQEYRAAIEGKVYQDIVLKNYVKWVLRNKMTPAHTWLRHGALLGRCIRRRAY